jgi:GMP synthase-like glutamine amidotransferase
MRVLIVDNKSAHLEKLRDLIAEKLDEAEFRLKDPRELDDTDMKWAELAVISGGWGRSIVKNPQTFERMVQYLANHKKPTIGICLGAEAIAAYYGSNLTENFVRRVGNVRIHLTEPLAKQLGLGESILAYEFHKWFIPEVSLPLQNLATSKDGVEILRHTSLPMWGMQFHPEVRRKDNAGHLVFEHALRDLGIL